MTRGVELRRQRAAAQEIGEGERPRPPEPRQHVAALAVEGAGSLAHLAAAEAGGVAGADDRADRGAGDHRRLDAELVEGLADEDVRHAAGAAAAKSKTDTRLNRHDAFPSGRESGGPIPARQDRFSRKFDMARLTARAQPRSRCDGAPADVAAAEALRPVDAVDRRVGARLRLRDVAPDAR